MHTCGSIRHFGYRAKHVQRYEKKMGLTFKRTPSSILMDVRLN